MLDWQTIWVFTIACIALCATPGPDMIVVAARSAAQGRTAGLMTHLGVATGSAFHALLLALGLSQLFLAVPYAYDLVRYLGAGYLLFLAWQAFTARSSFSTKSSQLPRRPLFIIFKQGFLSNLLNPKVALFYLALFPQFLDPSSGSVAGQILLLAIILQIVGLIIHGIVIWLASGMRHFMANGRTFVKWSRIFLGTVFGTLAARLVFDGQK